MGDLSKSLSKKDILRGFEKIAIQVVKDNKEQTCCGHSGQDIIPGCPGKNEDSTKI